tara:strand:- start:251 stop:712 length:462 start_codon:yes stop_codon:yes gene_type:complete
MSNLQVGDQAPFFSEKNQNGKIVSLSDYKQQKIILYFYPKDNTPGCTAQSCNLNDNHDILVEKGFCILGVSPDDQKSHLKFSEKYKFGFDLISDVKKKMCIDYGVWGEKKFMGRTYLGVHRTTFVINHDHIIERIFNKVETKNHTEQILESYK